MIAYIKYIKYGVILGCLSIALYGTYNAGYDSAESYYLKANNDATAALQKAQRAQLDAIKLRLTSAQDESTNNKQRAVELQELLDSRPTLEIIREIPKVDVGDCNSFSDEYNRLLHNIIGEAPNTGR